MSNEHNQRIEVAAGVAMAGWESLFSAELLANAKTLASQAGADVVTLNHVRDAAGPAVEKLLMTINREQGSDGQRKAA